MMNNYELLGVIAAYIGLIITVVKMISSQNKNVDEKLGNNSIKMAEMSKDISTIKEDLKGKANKDLVENQLKNINEKLDDIREMILQKSR